MDNLPTPIQPRKPWLIVLSILVPLILLASLVLVKIATKTDSYDTRSRAEVSSEDRGTGGQLSRTISIDPKKVGTMFNTRIVDVNSDGKKEFIFARQASYAAGANIFYMAVFDLNGSLLWEQYEPTAAQQLTAESLVEDQKLELEDEDEEIETESGEITDAEAQSSLSTHPKGSWQVTNMNADEGLEVASVWKKGEQFLLRVIDAKTGSTIAETPVKDRVKRLAVGDMKGRGFSGEIVFNYWSKDKTIRNALEVYSLVDGQLTKLCDPSSTVNGKAQYYAGSQPVFYDTDQDGKEEFFISTTLYDDNCQALWAAYNSGGSNHADSTFIGEVDGNQTNGAEIFTVAGAYGVIRINNKGEIVWRKVYQDGDHYQHITVANVTGGLRPELIVTPSKPKTNAARSKERLIINPNGELITTVSQDDFYPVNWSGNKTVIFQGRGFKFYSISRSGGSVINILPQSKPKDTFWIIAENVEGDLRDEILIATPDGKIRIYSNTQPLPCPSYLWQRDWSNISPYLPYLPLPSYILNECK